MPAHSQESSLSSSGSEDNKIERIAGLHLDGDWYLRLGWDIHYFPSQEINPILLKMFLEGRFGRDGYGLSLIGNNMYQVWSPDSLTPEDKDSCKRASRDLDDQYRARDSKQSLK